MDYKPWMDNITADDMPNDDLKFLAERIGIRTTLIMIFIFSGLTVSIPKDAFKRLKKKYIVNHYDGTRYSINQLATDCNYTQRYIYKIIEDHLKKRDRVQKDS